MLPSLRSDCTTLTVPPEWTSGFFLFDDKKEEYSWGPESGLGTLPHSPTAVHKCQLPTDLAESMYQLRPLVPPANQAKKCMKASTTSRESSLDLGILEGSLTLCTSQGNKVKTEEANDEEGDLYLSYRDELDGLCREIASLKATNASLLQKFTDLKAKLTGIKSHLKGIISGL